MDDLAQGLGSRWLVLVRDLTQHGQDLGLTGCLPMLMLKICVSEVISLSTSISQFRTHRTDSNLRTPVPLRVRAAGRGRRHGIVAHHDDDIGVGRRRVVLAAAAVARERRLLLMLLIDAC